MVVAFNSVSYDTPDFLCHRNRLIVFCSVVGFDNFIKMPSSASGYWSSAKRIESLDCCNCGSVLIACSSALICLASISAMTVQVKFTVLIDWILT